MRHVPPHDLAAVARRCGGGAPDAAPPPDALSWRGGGLLLEWVRRWSDRCELQWIAEHYPDELLDDVGLSRWQLMAEARKPFWRR